MLVEYDLHERIPDRTFLVSDIETLFDLCRDWEEHGGDPDGRDDCRWEPLESIRRRVPGVLRRYREEHEIIVVFHELAIRSICGVHVRVPHCGVKTRTDTELRL